MKKSPAVLYALVALCLCATVALGVCFALDRQADTPSGAFSENVSNKYIAYIGTKDKDTQQYERTAEESKAIVDAICQKHTNGYTTLNAGGGWRSSEKSWFEEETLIYLFFDIGEEELSALLDEVVHALNQESILVEKTESQYRFYP